MPNRLPDRHPGGGGADDPSVRSAAMNRPVQRYRRKGGSLCSPTYDERTAGPIRDAAAEEV